jgi:RNA-binding protein 5/10
MSYHNRDREWDRGKDYWQQDEYSWNDGPRGNTRGRDDDYYAEGKRRKYNNGVSFFAKPLSPLLLKLIFLQGYDGQKAYDDHDGGYSKRNDQGHGGGEGYIKKRLVPSEASPHVIFLGLDPDFTESDVSPKLLLRPRILMIVLLRSFKPISSVTAAASNRSR